MLGACPAPSISAWRAPGIPAQSPSLISCMSETASPQTTMSVGVCISESRPVTGGSSLSVEISSETGIFSSVTGLSPVGDRGQRVCLTRVPRASPRF
jgi:hypothetical protein